MTLSELTVLVLIIMGSSGEKKKREAGVADLGFVLRFQHPQARKGVHVISPGDENIAASLIADLEAKPASQCKIVFEIWRYPLRAPFSTHVFGALNGGIQDLQNTVHFYKHMNMSKYRRDSMLMSYNYWLYELI
jgi:hypothetical protein